MNMFKKLPSGKREEPMRIGIAALFATFVAALLNGVPAQAQQQFTMKLSSPTVNDVTHEWMKAFKAGVEGRSNGRVKVEIYPANQLGQIPATVEGVALGTIEFTVPAVGFLIGLEPRFQTLDAAGLFDSVEHAQKVMADPDIRKRLGSFGEAKGVEPLTTFVNGPMMLVSHKAVRTVADMRGQKLRVPGAAPLHIEPFRKVGASPVSLPLGEVLPALQNRGIDGAITAFTVLTAFKYYDISKSATYLPGTWAVVSGIVNRGFMKSLGPELEGIVRDEARKAEALFSTYGVEDVTRIRQTWERNGGEAITMAPAEAKKYLDEVTSVTPGIVSRNPKMKEDYDALLAASQKYR
jgi:TRAP-type C4-dicarboxylate transport system substrate-binding protein